MSIKKEILKPGSFYHIYNHAVGNDKLFFTENNYIYFLSKFSEYISPIADMYAYCLMSNHFHFLVKIKSDEEIFNFLKGNNKIPEQNLSLQEFKELSESHPEIDYFNLHLTKQFSGFFNGYAQAINNQENRKGNLFIKGFRRIEISSSEYLKDLILYIHTNPVHHHFADSLDSWKHSSYNSILSDKSTRLKRNEVIELFDGRENFIICHKAKNEEVMQRVELMMNE